jgi:hypothetical protein
LKKKKAGRKPLEDQSLKKAQVILYIEQFKIDLLGVETIRKISYKAIEKEASKNLK